MVRCNDEKGPTRTLYVAWLHVFSSGGRTSTLGILIIPLHVYAAKRRTYYGAHVVLTLFLRMGLGLVTIVQGLSQ